MSENPASAVVPLALRNGVPMLKTSSKKIKQVIVRLEEGSIQWASRQGTKVPVTSIRELRLGQPPTDSVHNDRWITIVYVRSGQWKVFHMVALTDDVYQLWIDTLKALVSETSDRLVAEVTPSDPDMMWIRQLWPAGANVIDPSKAIALCRQIGLMVDEDDLRMHVAPLDCHAFHQLVKNAQKRPEFVDLYTELAAGGQLDRVKVGRFLRDVQKLDPGNIFSKFQQGDQWTVRSLSDFLLSSDNAQNQAQDMTLPLQNYYISSSHNTYLVGEQWRGESTVEGYIRVLLAGCRCVEIDCHNGEPDPVVYHRKTLTSKVPLRDILKAIVKYGFIASPYPVIISAEVHCNTDQQVRLGTILREVLGRHLITAPIDESSATLPSPESLKYRILFKAKPPQPEKFSRVDTTQSDTTTSSTESDSGFARLARRLSISSTEKANFPPILNDLLIYTAGVKYQGFSKLVEYEPRHQFSVSERTANRIIRENKTDWVKHNFSHISRVYPMAVRLNSTNYDPVPYWAAGCQIVALNCQTIDEGTALNHAMFINTPGYVLKPLSLRQKIQDPPQRHHLRIQIISAQRLPLDSDLSVSITLGSATRKTMETHGKTLNPYWKETFDFVNQFTEAERHLSFLHLEVKGKTLKAQWVKSISAAPRGYHHLPLYDSLFSKYVFATLFVKIEIDEV